MDESRERLRPWHEEAKTVALRSYAVKRAHAFSCVEPSPTRIGDGAGKCLYCGYWIIQDLVGNGAKAEGERGGRVLGSNRLPC